MTQLPSDLQAIILDFDGTLASANYDFAGMRERIRALACEYGVDPRDVEGLYVLESVQRVAELLGAGTPRAREFRAQAERIILDLERAGASQARLVPGAAQALAALRDAGFRVAIVTRNSRAITDLIPGVRELVCDAFLARDSVRNVKPHPEHLAAALAALGCEAGRAAMVGDHPMDVAAGKAAGIATIGVLTGAGTRETLAAAGADVIVESVVELPQILGCSRRA